MSFWLVQILNGLSFGFLLFLLAAGLSLIFGLMRIINLAHGSFFMLGAYIALAVMETTGSIMLGVLAGVVAVALIGAVMQRLLLQRYQHNELAQVLMTFGFLLIISDLALWTWGGLPQSLPKPEFLSGSISFAGVTFPIYRLFIMAAGLIVALLLWLFMDRTKLGAIVRAGVDDEEMARGMGINMPNVFTAIFILGAALAALGGILAGPIIGAFPGLDFEVLLLAFVVVIVGGLGSMRGAFVGAMIVGLLDNFGKALVPEFSLFTVFVPMVIILAIRPTGLLGRE